MGEENPVTIQLTAEESIEFGMLQARLEGFQAGAKAVSDALLAAHVKSLADKRRQPQNGPIHSAEKV